MDGIKLDERQQRVLADMLSRIEQYRRGEVGFARLVGDLEAALDAGEFRDRGLIQAWYDRWTPLEVRNAVRGDGIAPEEVAIEIASLERLLHAVLEGRPVAAT